MISDVLLHILSYTGSGSYRAISKEWRSIIDKSNESIMSEARIKYPKAITVHEILRDSIDTNDLYMTGRILIDHVDYLPISLLYLISYIQTKDMAFLFKRVSRDKKILAILDRMIKAYDLYTSEYVKNIANNAYRTLNMINRFNLLGCFSESIITNILINMWSYATVPLKSSNLLELFKIGYYPEFIKTLVKDNISEYHNQLVYYPDDWCTILGMFDAINIFKDEEKSMSEYRYVNPYIHSRILDYILSSDNKIGEILNFFLSEGYDNTTYNDIAYMQYCYRILEYGVSEKYTLQFLNIAAKNRWIPILDKWSNTVDHIPKL